jgi:hypothetical protein
MAAPEALDVDPSAFADWLVSKGEDRLWTVDGEPRLAGFLSLPCTARELADQLRSHQNAKLRLFASGERPPIVAEIDEYVGQEDGTQVLEVAWVQDTVLGEHWMIAEDKLAEEAKRIATRPE